MDFGERVKELRRQLGLSQEQLGQRLGITKSMVSSYETSMRMPSYSVLIKMAGIFHVSTDYLLGLSSADTLDITGLTPRQKTLLLDLIAEFEQN